MVKNTDLFNSMVRRTELRLFDRKSRTFLTGIVNSISVEDGSGRSFFVTLHNCPSLLYVRCI